MSRKGAAGSRPGGADWVVIGHPRPSRATLIAEAGPAGVSGIRAADPAFSPDAFVAWSGSVFARAVAAWTAANPEPLRPVMAEEVWNQYSEWMLAIAVVALGRKLMASARAVSTLAGAGADERTQSVLIEYAVAMTDPRATALIPADRTRWHERWLFERPAGSHTHPSGAVAVCLACGGPAAPDDSQSCPYCHANITTRTAGWQVTRVATTQNGAKTFRPGGTALPPGSVGAPFQPPRAAAPRQPPRAT